MDDDWVTFKFWPKEKGMCQTTECAEVRKLKKHNEELIAYSENMQSKLDDERDKSQKLEQELKLKKEDAAYWMSQAISARELRNSDKDYIKQIVIQRDKLQKDNEKLREANSTWLDLHYPAPVREENKELKEAIEALSSDLAAADSHAANLAHDKAELERKWNNQRQSIRDYQEALNKVRHLVNDVTL